jgi:hypothetical protein
MAKKEQPELLKLLNARAAWNHPPFRQPRFGADQLAKIELAVSLHAEANNSDPYAADRMRMHLLRGLDSAEEVITEARNRLNAKQSAVFFQTA